MQRQIGPPQAENFAFRGAKRRISEGKLARRRRKILRFGVSKGGFPKANWLAAGGNFCDLGAPKGGFPKANWPAAGDFFAI